MATTRVQGNAVASSGTVTSLAGTLGSGVTAGNLLVASVSTGAIGNAVTPPTGWTQAVFNQPNSPDNNETGLWWAIVGSGGLSAGSTSWTFTFATAHNSYIIIEEWNSSVGAGWVASPVDQTAVGNTAGTAATATTIVSGTTATTTQASELWIASLVYSAGVQTESSITAGWTKDLETHDTGNNHTVTMLYQVVSSTGAAACQYTIGTAEHWAGCVATFKPVVVTTSSRTVPVTVALQSTNSRTVTGTAALQSTNNRTVPATAAFSQAGIARTIPATAALANNKSRTVPATASFTNSGSRIVPATVALQSIQNSRTVPATASLTVNSSRIIPATVSLAQSAVFYASNVATTIGGLTQSDQMSNTNGGTETSVAVTMPSSGTNLYVELQAQGGTSSGSSALPAPTGRGWSTPLQGSTILGGNWQSIFTLAKSGISMSGASLYVRWYRRTMDGICYLIGSTILTSQNFSTRAIYTTPLVSAPYPWQFVNGDTLYMDAFVFNGATAWASDVFTVYVSNSATQGVYNDAIIISPQLISTPAGLSALIGASSFQTGTTIPVLNQSFTLADAIDQRSILMLTGEDAAGTLSYQRAMPVQLSDHDQGLLYTGAVNSDKASKPAAGTSNAQLEHALTFMDNHYLVDKRANTTNYLNWTAGDMVCDFVQSTLSQEGVTGTFALESDYTPTAFGQGTLTNAVATTTTSPFTYAPNTAQPPITSNTGDLEIATAGSTVTITESTTSAFSGGILTNVIAANDSLTPTTVQAIRFNGYLPGSFGNATLTINFWSGSMTVAANDTLNYDIWMASTSPQLMATIDLVFSDGTTLATTTISTDATNLIDQSGITVTPVSDLSKFAKDAWYTRNISLASLSGKTITAVNFVFGGINPGAYTGYIKNCYLSSQSGSPFFSLTQTITNVDPPQVTGAFGYYASIPSAVVSVFDPATCLRISPSHSIDAAKLVRSASVTWTAVLVSAASSGSNASLISASSAVTLSVSYDGGVTYQPCTAVTNATPYSAATTIVTTTAASSTATAIAPLPTLPAGSSVAGTNLLLKETFHGGPDPTMLPTLLSVTVTIQSAANPGNGKTDIVTTYSNATQWNSGTYNNTFLAANNDVTLNMISRDWNDQQLWGQTWFPSFTSPPFETCLATNGTVTINVTGGTTARFEQSRLDFLGQMTNFTLNIDIGGSAPNTSPCIQYRQTAWTSTASANAAAYFVSAFSDGIRLYKGANSTSATGAPTQLAFTAMALSGTVHLQIVVNGSSHKVYVNNAPTAAINITDSTYIGAGYIGLANYTTPDQAVSFDNLVLGIPLGTWTSPSIALSSLGTCGGSALAWTEDTTIQVSPSSTLQATTVPSSYALVQASIDGGTTWKSVTNGGVIPQLAAGINLSGVSLVLKITLTSISQATVKNLLCRVLGSYGTATGTRISPALSLSPVGYVANSNVMWNANIPTSTSLIVQTTQDLSTFHTVGSNGAGEALPYWTNQPSATQDLFNTNTFANYTNTSKSGGSVASVLYESVNSRITLAGGSGALYLTTAITTADVDLLCDMDVSDTGGLVWRKVDANNYYELGVYDNFSTGGFTNQLRLYKVASGTRSLLGTASAITFTSGTFHRIRVTMQGGLINVYWDGQCKQSYLDTSPLGAGKTGLRNDGGTSRYYQLWIQPLGTNLTGQALYTKVTMTTTDPSVMPQLFTLVACVRGPSIGTGATVSQLHPITKPFSTYYHVEMDSLVQQSGDYYWYVDKWRQLHFGPRLARPGAFPVMSATDQDPANPTNVHSGYLLYQPQVSVLSSADLFRNQQDITNVNGLVTPPPEIKVADGSTTSWQMGYPLYSAPTILINGQAATVGLQGVDNNRQFYWQPGSASISYDSSLPKLPSGTLLSFTYVGESSVNVTLNNLASQVAQAALELNSGIVAEIETALNSTTQGMTTAQATTFGNGLLSRYGSNNTIEMVGTTMYAGLAPGTIVPLFLPELLSTWNTQLPIVKVTTTAYQGNSGIVYLYSINATNGPNLSNWARAWNQG